ncbi:MAG: DUF460 domain-containing protein [Candidatus Bathyarchaeia archaeon]
MKRGLPRHPLPTTGPKNKVVVGVDPGFTSGLAILDLNGVPLQIRSLKGAGRALLIEEITRHGEPILITCDVSQAPDLVRKISSAFNSAIFTPEKSLSVKEKRELLEEFSQAHGIELRQLDSHSQDALAAAYKALKRFRNKFEKLEEAVRHLTTPGALYSLKAMIVKGYTISKALAGLLIDSEKPRPQTPSVNATIKEELNRLREQVAEYEQAISRLSRELRSNRAVIKEMKEQNERLKVALESERRRLSLTLRRDILYQNQSRQIASLTKRAQEAEAKYDDLANRLRRLQALKREGRAGGLTLLKPVDTFTEEGVERAIEEMDIKQGDTVLILNAGGGGAATAKRLIGVKPRAIIICTAMSHQAEDAIRKSRIPIFSSSELSIIDFDGIPAVNTAELEEKTLQKRRDSEYPTII